MTNKYVGLEQYKRSIDSIKKYIDKSIPHVKIQELITIPADKVLEIHNSNNHVMEFDKPSDIDLNCSFVVNYNNTSLNCVVKNGDPKTIEVDFNDYIDAIFVPGYDINHNVNENKMVVCINLNSNTSPTDLVLKQIDANYLKNKCLKDDVAIKNSITIGSRNIANEIGQYSFSNGEYNTASGENSHAEGHKTIASGYSSHTEGYNTTASNTYSHAEGSHTTASGYSSHAEGCETTASGERSHAEGYCTKASNYNSHAEGYSTTASGNGSHAEGCGTRASANYSHAEGYNTKASSQYQHVQGKYNIEDTANAYAHIVGNGSSDDNKSNAHTLDWNGNAWYQGSVYTGGTSQDDTNAKKLATEEYVNDSISSITVPTITNDLTNALKANYDAAYTHSQSAHAPSNAQKNSDITKAEIEAKLTGDITTHTHSQYLTKHQDISGLALKSELHTHTNKAILDAITSDKISSWDNKSTFSGSYKDLADKPTIPSVEGFATESYVDSKFLSEEIIFEGQSNDPLVLFDYYTHVPIDDGLAFWVIDKTLEINSTYNPYTVEISGCQPSSLNGTYGPELFTYNSTYDMWECNLGNGSKIELGNTEYQGSNKMVVSWDTAGNYSNLKVTKRIDLMNTINSKVDKAYVDGKVSDLVNSSPATLDTLKELADALGNDPNFATTVSNQIGNKVDKISGKGLSTNDLTSTLKANYDAAYNHSKSAHAPSNAQKNSDITKAEIEAKLTGNITSHTHSQYLTEHQSLNGYAKTADLATVATSGSYNDLTNKPTIPTVTNDLTNALKSNYDKAYTHSQVAHAPSNAQKNSDITKSEIEAKLTGNITTHTHSQYLTSIPSEYITEQELTSKGYITEAVLTSKGYATESQINSAVEAAATTHEEVKTTVNQILGGAYIE